MRRIGRTLVVAVVVLLFSFSSVFSAKIGSVSFKEKIFKNGLKVFVARTTEVPMFSFYLVIPAGSAMDEAGKEGQANLTAGLLLKGADGMSAEEIAKLRIPGEEKAEEPIVKKEKRSEPRPKAKRAKKVISASELEEKVREVEKKAKKARGIDDLW